MDRRTDPGNDAEEARETLAACSCPRRPDEEFSAPKCGAAQLIGSSDNLLMLDPQRLFPGCPRFVHFGHSHFCSCPARVRAFKRFGI